MSLSPFLCLLCDRWPRFRFQTTHHSSRKIEHVTRLQPYDGQWLSETAARQIRAVGRRQLLRDKTREKTLAICVWKVAAKRYGKTDHLWRVQMPFLLALDLKHKRLNVIMMGRETLVMERKSTRAQGGTAR